MITKTTAVLAKAAARIIVVGIANPPSGYLPTVDEQARLYRILTCVSTHLTIRLKHEWAKFQLFGPAKIAP
jgi:hypothetical protein